MAHKSAIRAAGLKTIGKGRNGIASAESHAKREDPVAQSRVVRPSDPLAWSKASGLTVQKVLEKGQPPQDVVCSPLDYVEAFKAHKRKMGAGERKGADLGMEFKAIVSPDWLAETGDPRDRKNPRVQQLMIEAARWAESWGGEGAVWAVRYDTDEKGAGVVDLFMSPVREQRHKNGSSKVVISCRKAKEELLATERTLDPEIRTSGAAMQSSWARWCQQTLDPRIERGQPKAETGREHVHADIYSKIANEARRAALETVEAEKQEMLAETRKLHQEALEESAEAKRIKDAARRDAQKMVMEAKKRGQDEKQRIIAQAIEPEAMTKVLDESRQLRAENNSLHNENTRLRAEVSKWRALVESMKATLASLFGSNMEAVRARVDADWAKDPKNPDRGGQGYTRT